MAQGLKPIQVVNDMNTRNFEGQDSQDSPRPLFHPVSSCFQVRKIKELPVFVVTTTFSIFAPWQLVQLAAGNLSSWELILSVTLWESLSPQRVDVWELHSCPAMCKAESAESCQYYCTKKARKVQLMPHFLQAVGCSSALDQFQGKSTGNQVFFCFSIYDIHGVFQCPR